MGGKVAVLFKKCLDLEVRMNFMDPWGKLMAQNVSNSEGGAFRLVVVYIPTGWSSQISSNVWKFSVGRHAL